MDILPVFTGLGLFLAGLHLLESGIEGLGSSRLRDSLQRYTSNPLTAIATGSLTTAIMQSSSLVGLIVLAFVGTGLLELRNAVGVIMGSNLGTTATGWLLAWAGFRLPLSDVASAAILVGAAAMVLATRQTRVYWLGAIVLGPGLILLGLDEITLGFGHLASRFDTGFIAEQPIWVYFISGLLVTSLLQSSSAVMMILLTAIHSGMLGFAEAAPVAIGSNIGTTTTLLLGAIPPVAAKRRVALAHAGFNLVTAVVALMILAPLEWLITQGMGIADPLYQLVTLHTLFNALGILLFLPFIDPFVSLLVKLAPDHRRRHAVTGYLTEVPADIPEGAVEAVRLELTRMLVNGIRLNAHALGFRIQEVFDPETDQLVSGGLRHVDDYPAEYRLLKESEGAVLTYGYQALGYTDNDSQRQALTDYSHGARNVIYAIKFLKDIQHNLADFQRNPVISEEFRTNYTQILRANFHSLVTLLAGTEAEQRLSHYETLQKEIRQGYEWYLNETHQLPADKLRGDELGSLLNLNRAVYLSFNALLEAARSVLAIDTPGG